FGQGFAVLLSQDSTEVVHVIFQKLFQLEKRLDAVLGWGAAPFRKSGGGGLNRGIDFGSAAKRSLRDDLAGSRVSDIDPFAGTRVDPLAVNEVGNLCQSGNSNSHKFISQRYCSGFRPPGFRSERGRPRHTTTV